MKELSDLFSEGRALGKFKVGKYFLVEIKNHHFTFERDADKITQDQQRDGIYVIRTSLSSEDKDSFECVRTYKSLAKVESAFSYSQKRTESSAYLSLETRAGEAPFTSVYAGLLCGLAHA